MLPTAEKTSEKNGEPATRDLLERYGLYLAGQRSLSANTRRIYRDDLRSFLTYCRQEGYGLRDMNRQLLRGYVAHLATVGRMDGPKPSGYARVSIVRKLTALRTFYNFLVQEGWFKSTPVPSDRACPVKVEKPLPEPIPDTPENVMRAILATPPRKDEAWRYLREADD